MRKVIYFIFFPAERMLKTQNSRLNPLKGHYHIIREKKSSESSLTLYFDSGFVLESVEMLRQTSRNFGQTGKKVQIQWNKKYCASSYVCLQNPSCHTFTSAFWVAQNNDIVGVSNVWAISIVLSTVIGIIWLFIVLILRLKR